MVSREQLQHDDDGSTKTPASRTEMVEMKKPNSNKKQKVNEEEEKEQQQGNNTTTTTQKSALSIPTITTTTATTTASMMNSRSGQQKSDRQRVSDLESKAREILGQESERDRLARKKRRRNDMDKLDACCAECGIGCTDCCSACGECCVIQ